MTKRILIPGGGFGGVYAALDFERRLSGGQDVEITLVSRENFLLFTPMLHEVAVGDVDVTSSVCPLRQLVKRTIFLQAESGSNV